MLLHPYRGMAPYVVIADEFFVTNPCVRHLLRPSRPLRASPTAGWR